MISIATGSLHCVACTDGGEVFTWGDNDEGQLGDGSTNAIQRPRLVAALQGKKINRVACGSAHTLAWSTNKPVATSKLPASVRVLFETDVYFTLLKCLLFHCRFPWNTIYYGTCHPLCYEIGWFYCTISQISFVQALLCFLWASQ